MNTIATIRTLLRGALLAACIPALAMPALAATAGGTTANTGTHPPAATVAKGGPVHSGQTMPAALRPVFYQALAKDAGPTYHINKDGCAVLPKQTLTGCFDDNGARFVLPAAKAGNTTSARSANEPLSLHLVAFGRGGQLASVPSVRPEINGNEASYRHGTITEWWRVLPVGFEQGFTIAKRPSGNGELTLALAMSRQDAGAPSIRHSRAEPAPAKAWGGNPVQTSPSIPLRSEGGNGVVSHLLRSERGKEVAWGKLRYGQLVVTDAKGKVVPATLTSKGDRILIAVNDTHAAYPLTVDPLVWLEQKVTSNDGAAQDQFGSAVAIDGTTALVGAPNAASSRGAVYVFSATNGAWAQAKKLMANDGAPNDEFGASVALDGTTALIGAPDATSLFSIMAGAAYVFSESGGSWTQTAKLTDSLGGEFYSFGASVALKGTTALVGEPNFLPQDPDSGSGQVLDFEYSGGGWTLASEMGVGGVGGFGTAIAISSDDTVALLTSECGYVDPTTHACASAGDVFEATKTQGQGHFGLPGQVFTSSDGVTGDHFGHSIVLAPGGTTAIIGAPDAAINGNASQGAAYMFNDVGGTWTQEQKLTAADGVAGDNFGESVALDGATALVGAVNATGNDVAYMGVAYVFDYTGGAWIRTGKLTADGATTAANFGEALALDGTTALIGAPCAFWDPNAGECGPGAAYFASVNDLGLTVSAPAAVTQGAPYVAQTIATNNATSTSAAVTATMAVPAAASFISALATQGSCNEASNLVTCDFGPILGNAGEATANVTLKATGDTGTTIHNTASLARTTPPVTASAASVIQASDHPPVAQDGTLSTHWSAPASGTLEASDPDGDPITYVIDTAPEYGALTLNDPSTGAYTYTPEFGYVGTDSFTFHASDGTLNSNEATVTVSLTDTAPVAQNGTLSTTENTPVNGTLVATDADGDPITSYETAIPPSHGTITWIDETAGTYTYTPDTGYTGSDSFTFHAFDGAEYSNDATISITVGSADSPPVAQNGTLGTHMNTPGNGTLVATDPDGDPLTYVIDTQPADGTVVLNDASTGAYTYTPNNGYTGSDSFTFHASDGTLDSNEATINISVTDTAPVAQNGTLSTSENTAANGTLVATDPDGDPLTYAIDTQPANGTVTLNDASTGAYTYTPNTGYTGSDSFTFHASDGVLSSNEATISITVNSGGGGGSCPTGYATFNGSLGPRQSSPVLTTYHAPAGVENGILIAPAGFVTRLGFHKDGSPYWRVYRIRQPVIYKRTPAGTFKWAVQAGSSGGAYTLCISHP